MITQSTDPTHPDDRLAIWYSQRSRYMNELATKRKAIPRPEKTACPSEAQKRGIEFPAGQKWLTTAILTLRDAIGGLLLASLGLWMVVLIGYLIGEIK